MGEKGMGEVARMRCDMSGMNDCVFYLRSLSARLAAKRMGSQELPSSGRLCLPTILAGIVHYPLAVSERSGPTRVCLPRASRIALE